MDGDETGWQPARPLPPATFELPVRPLRLGSADAGERGDGGQDPAPSRKRRSARSRVLLSYLAGAAVTALLVTGGSAAQPVYGSERPFGGVGYAEVRDTPAADGWSLPLEAEFDAGVSGVCLAVRAGQVDAHHELVTATVPTAGSTGRNAECEAASADVPGRLVMADPATGRVLWRRDLARDLGGKISSLLWHSSTADGARSLVVGVNGSTGDALLTLDVDTGRTLSRTSVDSPDAAIDFAVSGSLVVSVVPDVAGTVNTYTLRQVAVLGDPLWTRSISSVLQPQLLPGSFVVPLPEGTVAVDGRDGHETDWKTDLRGLADVRIDGDRIVAQTLLRDTGGPPTVVSLDRFGDTVWSHPATGITGLTVARRCVVLSIGALRQTCLDPSTGRTRWTTDLAGAVVGTPEGSTTGDVETIAPVHARDATLAVSELDGDTGRVRFVTHLARGATIVGQAAATGYALTTSASDGESTLTAFDLDSGRTLWTLTRERLDVWGGHPVEITAGGVVRELGSVRTHGRHAMLVG